MEDQFLAKVNQVIEDNIDNEHFSVEELAHCIGLSRSMLHRKIKKTTGKSVGDYITKYRITKAKELIETSEATISEIAYNVGFNDPSYFSKVFKKHFRFTPGEIRKQCSNQTAYIKTSDKHRVLIFKDVRTRQLFFKSSVILLIISISIISTYFLFGGNKPLEESVAVLPLHNLTGHPENAYFVDGMHDALIGELSRIESLRVISRTSTLRYRNKEMLMQDIADELGVKFIVEGSVASAGDSVRIIIQMIDVFPSERHVLTREYHDNMQNAITIQSNAAKDIVENIRVKLSKENEQALQHTRSVNPETYKYYLKGLYHLNQGTSESFEKGIFYMCEAIEKDPGDPLAYAGLSLAYALKGHGSIAPAESFKSALAAAERALRLDPNNDEAYTAMALIYLYKQWNWEKAKKAFEEAIKHNPNNEIAHAHFAWYHMMFNEMEKSIYHAKQATIIEPFSPSYHSWLALLYFYDRQYEKAETSALKSLEFQEDAPYGLVVLGWIYLQNGQHGRAIEIHEKLPKTRDYYITYLGNTYVRTGNYDKALDLWNECEEYSKDHWMNPFYSGLLAGALGFTDKAFELLNEACDHKYYPLIHIDGFLSAQYLRNDFRYVELMKRMNLPYENSILTAQQ